MFFDLRLVSLLCNLQNKDSGLGHFEIVNYKRIKDSSLLQQKPTIENSIYVFQKICAQFGI